MDDKPVCSTSDVPDNGMAAFDVENGPRVLVLNSGENYYCYQAICPHQEVELCDGFYDGCTLTCHQHLWQWDVTTGAPVGLAEAPLERYDVKVDNGFIYVVSEGPLKQAELFAGISNDTLEAIIGIARREEFKAGSVLYKPGDPARDLYVLDSGRVEFLIGRDERMSPAGFMLRKGEVFGWAALLEQMQNRIATATCMEDSKLVLLDGQELLKILERAPADGLKVMRRLTALVAKQMAGQGSE